MHKLNISMDMRVNRMKIEKLGKLLQYAKDKVEKLTNKMENVKGDTNTNLKKEKEDHNIDEELESLKCNVEYLEQKIEYLTSDNDEKQETLDALDLASETIDIGNSFHPFKLLGFTCSYELAYSIAYSVVTFFIYVIQAFISNNGTGYGG